MMKCWRCGRELGSICISKSTAATMWLWVHQRIEQQEECRRLCDQDGDAYPPNLLDGIESFRRMLREIEAYQKERGWKQ